VWRVSWGGVAHQGAGVRQDLPVSRPTADTSYFAISRTSSSAAERASVTTILQSSRGRDRHHGQPGVIVSVSQDEKFIDQLHVAPISTGRRGQGLAQQCQATVGSSVIYGHPVWGGGNQHRRGARLLS
jgi:hypothetical protein